MSAEEHEHGRSGRELKIAADSAVSGSWGGALVKLAALVERPLSFEEIGCEVDRILGPITHLPNLFICLIREVPPSIRFVYCRDEHDRHVDRPMDGLGLTDQVYLRQKSLLLPRAEANHLLQTGELVNHGVPSLVWLGVPLIVGGKVRAVMATQDYESPDALTAEHEACLNLVAPLIAAVVEQARQREARHVDEQADPARSRQKKALIATIGHDVRSPLAVIQGYSDLLRDTLKNNPAGTSAGRIAKAARELAAATDRMIDYTTVEAGVQATPDTSVDLRGWKRSLVHWLETAAAPLNLATESDMTASGTAFARFNAEHVRQLIQHLLRVAFSVEGVAKVQLGLRVQPVVTIPHGLLRLAFEIQAQLPPEITSMHPWRDLKISPIDLLGDRTYDGSSVSLAIAERLAEKLGADVQVGSQMHAPWRASVVLTVPVEEAELTALGEDRRDAMSVMRSKLQEQSNRMAVLDADAETRGEVVSLVEEAVGARPMSLVDREGLLRGFADEDLRVVIAAADKPEPVADLARILASSSSAPVAPYLIVISREQDAALVERLLDAGADAYVPRPLNSAALLIALSDAWLEHERRRERAALG